MGAKRDSLDLVPGPHLLGEDRIGCRGDGGHDASVAWDGTRHGLAWDGTRHASSRSVLRVARGVSR
jgi:hypothetical protein